MFGNKKNAAPKAAVGKSGTLKPIEIFKAGTHTNAAGKTVAMDEDDLQACADAFDPDDGPAPLVVGHPKNNAPAYGWVHSLECRDRTLYATPGDDVDPDFADAVNAGRYNRVSSAFYAPGSANNPKKGTLYLKHVGFLGVEAPAVKGMRPAQIVPDEPGPLLFSECPLAFSEEADPWRRTAQPNSLRERERALRRREDEMFTDNLTRQGRLLPHQKTTVLAFCEALDDDQMLEFSEGGEERKVGMRSAFLDFLKKMPKVIEFGEVAHRGNDVMGDPEFLGVNLPKGMTADPASLELHKKAIIHKAIHKCSYPEAVRAVAAKNGGA